MVLRSLVGSGMCIRGSSRIEEGATFGSGLEGGGSLSFLGRYQDWVVLRLGIGLQSNFDSSSVHLSPVFRLRMRLHERLWAETGGRNGRPELPVTLSLTHISRCRRRGTDLSKWTEQHSHQKNHRLSQQT